MRDESCAHTAVDAALAELEAMVAEHGVAVRVVAGSDPDSDDGAFAYTVGLSRKDHPELVCDGLPQDSSYALLDQLGRRVVEDGVVLEHGQLFHADAADADQGLPVAIITAEDDDDLTAVAQLYGARSALQVIWPDSTGRLPWHQDYANPPQLQRLRGPVPVELLSLPCPDVPPSPAAAHLDDMVLTTRAVSEGAAVTTVRHEADGGWQLLDGDGTDDPVLVVMHRRHLVDADHTLATALSIPAGSLATRDSADADWVRWPLGSA